MSSWNNELIRAASLLSLIVAFAAAAAKSAAQEPKNAADDKAAPPKQISLDLGRGVKLEMVLVPAGEFMMGSPEWETWCADGARPRHRVRITRPFYLGKYTVTQEQWEAVMGSNPSDFKAGTNPVTGIDGDDCKAFIKRLDKKFGGGEFRLPTEAQWEYACRAGSKTRFSFGDDEKKLSEYAWCDTGGYGVGHPHPVGKKKPNVWGLYDMHGNVFEICADLMSFDYYARSPIDDPTGPSRNVPGGVLHWSNVYRGCAWFCNPPVHQSSWRQCAPTSDQRAGFRLARVIPGEFAEFAWRNPEEARAAPATPRKEISVDLGKGVELDMVLIPAGEFEMGSPESQKDVAPAETPRHRVRITKPFYLGKYPVTQEQWRQVMGASPTGFVDPAGPVESVTWNDSENFVMKLNAYLGGAKFRIPTEAQWEYACRAGTKTRYSFGDDESKLDEYGWFEKNSASQAHAVGKKKPNAWGLFDMHGNVGEWCSDWYDGEYYKKSPTDDPPGPVTGTDRTIRGGSWRLPPQDCSSAARGHVAEAYYDATIGFRIARDIRLPRKNVVRSASAAPRHAPTAVDEPLRPDRGARKPLDEVSLDLGQGIKLQMVLVPAGQFTMGSPVSDDDAEANETPRHGVRITEPFWLAKYPVTQEQWKAVMGENPSKFSGPTNPAENVTWFDCDAFVSRLGAKFGGGEFRLPTEAQWEYACRAGSKARYCFGDDESELDQYGWSARISNGHTHPVGERRPNDWGLYDMYGNVSEWCADWYDGEYYAKSPSHNPTGPATGSERIVRGGAWLSAASDCRSASRGHASESIRNETLGFRIARDFQRERANGPPKPPVAPLKEVSLDIGNGGRLQMVLIPAGEFVMGIRYAENHGEGETPQHRVRITKPFWMGKFPVTQQQWEQVMGDNPSAFRGPMNPVENVSWSDCQDFMLALNAKLRGGEFRLPTEAQWEYACRAGSKTRYCFGDDENKLGEYAWYSRNADGRTHPVGEKKPNAWGLYDMHGNVLELCADWYDEDYYAKSPIDDPNGPGFGVVKAIRGASWLSTDCRSSSRGHMNTVRDGCCGFRVSRAASEK